MYKILVHMENNVRLVVFESLEDMELFIDRTKKLAGIRIYITLV